MLSCWDITSSKRPRFIELRNTFSALISKSSGTTYIDLVADLDEANYIWNEDIFAELTDSLEDDYDHIIALGNSKEYDHIATTDAGEYDHIRYDQSVLCIIIALAL